MNSWLNITGRRNITSAECETDWGLTAPKLMRRAVLIAGVNSSAIIALIRGIAELTVAQIAKTEAVSAAIKRIEAMRVIKLYLFVPRLWIISGITLL